MPSRSAAPAAASSGSEPDHGSRARYRRGCRCLPCQHAHAVYRRSRRLLNLADPWVPAHHARAHLETLQAAGIGLHRVAVVTGLTIQRVQRIRNGSVRRVRASVERSVLGVRDPCTLGTLRPAGRARQLLRWFHAEGFTLRELAARLGLSPATVACRRARVTLRTELSLSAYRRALSDPT